MASRKRRVRVRLEDRPSHSSAPAMPAFVRERSRVFCFATCILDNARHTPANKLLTERRRRREQCGPPRLVELEAEGAQETDEHSRQRVRPCITTWHDGRM